MMKTKKVSIRKNRLKARANIYFYSFIYSCVGIGIAIGNPLKANAQNTVNFPTPQDFATQQMATKAIQICSLIEGETQKNPNNYQARSLLNNCMLLLQQRAFCMMQKTSEIATNNTSPNFYECDAELARFAQIWGGQ
jgi:hypothetical protein